MIPAAQEWKITPLLGPTIVFTSAQMNTLPNGFSILGSADNITGIKVIAKSYLNNATFQCIAFVVINPARRNDSTRAIATLQVAGTQYWLYVYCTKLSIAPLLLGEPGQFSCGPVSCPPLYSPGVDNTCTVQWSAPWTVDCAPLTSYTITVTKRYNGEVVSNSSQSPLTTRMHNVTVSEPAVDYTVTFVAVNRIGSNDCAVEFMSPKEQSRCVFILFLFSEQIVIIPLCQEPVDFTLEVTVSSSERVFIMPMVYIIVQYIA